MYRIIGDRSSKFFKACNCISVHLTPLKTVVLTWMMGLSIALPPLLGWAYYAPEPSGLRYLYLIYVIWNTKCFNYLCIMAVFVFVFFIQSIIWFSCAPAWDDNTNVSYTIYIFLVGFFTPNSIIICTSAGVLRIHKKVNCYCFKYEWYNWKVSLI